MHDAHHTRSRYPATYTSLIARLLKLDQAGCERLLAGSGLHVTDLASARISEDAQMIIIGNALSLSQRSDLGLVIGSRLSLAAHGALGQLLASSPDLGEAWTALERFQALRVPGVSVRRQQAGDHIGLQLQLARPLDAIGLFLLEAMVVTIQRGIELVLGRRLQEARLMLGYPAPPHAASYTHYIHSPLSFDEHITCWRIPQALMQLPNPFRDDALWRDALRQCEAASDVRGNNVCSYADPVAPRLWSQRISAWLHTHAGRRPTLQEAAQHWHLSTRTLIRHLKAEETSYQTLLDERLAQQAMTLLTESGHTVESAALALGYGEATAFRRAFRRWTGMAPRAWKAASPNRA